MKKFIRPFFSRRPPDRKGIKVLFRFKSSPWGGGNQFLKALRDEFIRAGVFESDIKKAQAVIFNSHHDLEEVARIRDAYPDLVFVHRIDGPIQLIRGGESDVDDRIFEANNRLADGTVFQSKWSLDQTLLLNYRPRNPVVILNAPDDRMFNQKNRKPSNPSKTRIISSSWSTNPRKGLQTYKWLDENLDFDECEYTFVGRVESSFNNIRVVKPVVSKRLSRYLQNHDIFITASQNDPCSNAVIEALACGLPTIYYRSGGHPELVKDGGLGFNNAGEIPGLIKNIRGQLDLYRGRISVQSIADTAKLYQKYCLTCNRSSALKNTTI